MVRDLVTARALPGHVAVHAMENPQVIQGGDDTGMKFAVHGLVNLQQLR